MSIRFHELKKKNKWVVTWKNPWTGKKHTQSFETESNAIAFLDAQTSIAQKEKLLLKKRQQQKSARYRITIKELMSSYFRLAHTNPVTIRQAGYHASHILSAFGNKQCSRLDCQDILNFSEAQHLRGIAQITINRRVSILRSALNWAVQNGILQENPLRNLRMPRAKARRIAPPTPQEAQAMLRVAAPHVQRVIMIGLCAGPRIGPSELFQLQWKDIDMENAMMRMPSAHKNQLEDGRDIPIRKALLPYLKRWKEIDAEQGLSHVITYGGRPVKCIGRAWHSALARAGITRRIRPYDLRHAFATYALAGNADIGTVARLMGHVDASMILRTYQHVQDTQKRAAVEAAQDVLALETSLYRDSGRN